LPVQLRFSRGRCCLSRRCARARSRGALHAQVEDWRMWRSKTCSHHHAAAHTTTSPQSCVGKPLIIVFKLLASGHGMSSCVTSRDVWLRSLRSHWPRLHGTDYADLCLPGTPRQTRVHVCERHCIEECSLARTFVTSRVDRGKGDVLAQFLLWGGAANWSWGAHALAQFQGGDRLRPGQQPVS
jgi:hypothetical protein